MSHFIPKVVLEETPEYTLAYGDSELFGKRVLALQWHIEGATFPMTNNKPDWCPVPESLYTGKQVDGALRDLVSRRHQH
jgi:hypothetical protein